MLIGENGRTMARYNLDEEGHLLDQKIARFKVMTTQARVGFDGIPVNDLPPQEEHTEIILEGKAPQSPSIEIVTPILSSQQRMLEFESLNYSMEDVLNRFFEDILW